MKTRRLAVIALCLPLLACYEEPVRDHLHIAFSPGPEVVITAVREIAPESSAENAAVEERMNEARTELASGWDRWSRSFADLGATAERSTIERRDGQASRGIHSALVDSFRPLERLLGNEGLGAYFDESGRVRELQLHPTGTGQATRQERATLDEALASWSVDVSAYLAAATALYAHLDQAPDRAIPCFAHIFDEHPESSGPLSEQEEKLMKEINEAMERVALILLIDSGDAYSLNELSRLVFDTFQGRLTLALDGSILEIEGFTEGDGFIERPPVSLWRSFETMVGQWIEPDLITELVRPGPEEIQPQPDPVEFASRPRSWASAPDPASVEAELRNRLTPEPVYLVRWETRPAPEDEDEIKELASRLLQSAELDLPD